MSSTTARRIPRHSVRFYSTHAFNEHCTAEPSLLTVQHTTTCCIHTSPAKCCIPLLHTTQINTRTTGRVGRGMLGRRRAHQQGCAVARMRTAQWLQCHYRGALARARVAAIRLAALRHAAAVRIQAAARSVCCTSSLY
eukprot:20662-Heterococcus_DN1.PRE.6